MDMTVCFTNKDTPTNKLKTLREKMLQLKCKGDDIDEELQNEELRARKKRKREVNLWLQRVRRTQNEVHQIGKEVEEAGFAARQRLSKELELMITSVEELLKRSEFPRGLVLDDFNKPEGIELVAEKLEGSTPSMVEDKVWNCLVRGESRIGIHGMGGVGKTSVAMHINNRILAGTDVFKRVYYVTVSRDTSVYKLQRDIAKALNYQLDDEDDAKRAAKLNMALKQRDKCLLILDDVWEAISMQKIGLLMDGVGCKLLITSRKKDVRWKMNCSTAVEMKPLSKDDAWALFVKRLGNYEALCQEVKHIARLVATECAGLPLGIITIAGCMRRVFDEHEWRTALRKLQSPSGSQHDMEDKVFNILKFSYDCLGDVQLQQCFLCCALYPEDQMIEIDELIRHFIAEGLVDGGTRQENISEGHSLLNALENASLLECATDNYERRCVKMHDLVRDMAIKIMRENGSGMVKAGKGLKKVPGELEWTKDLVRVSLMINEIESIGGEICPQCPKLSVLILHENPLKIISHSFFVHMSSLKVLDLSYTSISILPDSVSDLCNLNALLLSTCQQLHFIPSMAKLTKLKQLDLRFCGCINELPQGMEELIDLKHLDLRKTGLKSIPNGLICKPCVPEGFLCKLCNLESLLSNYRITLSPKELMSLTHLQRFMGRIDDLEGYSQWIRLGCFNKLESYSLIVGHFDYQSLVPSLNSQNVDDRRISTHGCHIAREMCFPHNVQELYFSDCSFGSRSLVDALPRLCDARELVRCKLVRCEGMKCIVSERWLKREGQQDVLSTSVQEMQHLEIDGLDNFCGLVEGEAVHPFIFSGLKKLEISRCPNVKLCLSNFDLPSLEHVKVKYCEQMEEIFATPEGATLKLLSLRSLTLLGLSELRSICTNALVFPNLLELDVAYCPKLENLGLLNQDLPSLERIIIADCEQVEEIFAVVDEAGDDAIQLPNLKTLHLKNLPELRSICTKTIVCNSLEGLFIGGSSGEKMKNCPISVPRLLAKKHDARFPRLQAWDRPRDWWDSLHWNDPDTKAALRKRPNCP